MDKVKKKKKKLSFLNFFMEYLVYKHKKFI